MSTYLIIFSLKVLENAISTLRMILVSNGRKYLATILQLICSVIWIISTSMVIMNIQDDFFKIIAFALGCTVGSYIGSILEEKIALGSNMVICISSLDIMDEIRNNGYSLTSTKGTGMETKNIIFIMVLRKQKRKLISLLNFLDKNCFIISGLFSNENKKVI